MATHAESVCKQKTTEKRVRFQTPTVCDYVQQLDSDYRKTIKKLLDALANARTMEKQLSTLSANYKELDIKLRRLESETVLLTEQSGISSNEYEKVSFLDNAITQLQDSARKMYISFPTYMSGPKLNTK